MLDAVRACQLHLAFLNDALGNLLSCANDLGEASVSIAWALDGGGRAESAFSHVPGFVQEGATLGDRLFHGLSRVAEASEVVLAIGSDHPELTSKPLRSAALSLLEGRADMVVIPADDGGYSLIGVTASALDAQLFSGISWSSSLVLEQTLSKAFSLDLAVERLPTGHDVDTPADLAALCARLEGRTRNDSACACPHTVALLRRWKLLGQGAPG